MSNLKLFCQPKPDYYFFSNEIYSRVKSGKKNWMLLLPVNRAVRIFSKNIISQSPNNIIESPAVFTFDNVMTEIYRHLPQSKTIVKTDLLTFLISPQQQWIQYQDLQKLQNPKLYY